MSDKITFRYHPNVYDSGIVTYETGVCECCGDTVTAFSSHMYCRERVRCICLPCIKSGKAAEKFDGQFIQDAEINKVHDPEKIEELFKRTPGYLSWQGENWLACCDDFCAFLGDVGTEELEKMGIADEVFAEYSAESGFDDARDYLKAGGSLAGYLFRCLHCGKYHLQVDAD